MEKGSWVLAGTRLQGKVKLLARALVITMVVTSIQIMHLLRHHRLVPIIIHKGMSLHRIPRILGGVPPVDPMGIGVGPCPGFHWVWNGFPLIGIPGKGTGPCHGFQGPCEEGIPKCAPCAGIVPCIGCGCP
jgi:hypothetical protein